MWEVDFSIGPVQGFVAQSRRTRDLWGSSYLLSYLAAQAMRGAVKAGGDGAKVIRPIMDNDPLYQWVISGGKSGPLPRIGSVPNHFVVCTKTKPQAQAVAAAATEAFRAAWRKACDAVWARYVQDAAARYGEETKAIWDRQIARCWEITWVASDTGQSSGLLARRKHWRTHRLPDEPGDKCTVMPDFQELSGHVRVAGGAEHQRDFWKAVRGKAGRSEIRVADGERLCAPALVKRLFAKRWSESIGGEPNAKRSSESMSRGLDVERWPSTMHIGAMPWLREVREHASEQARAYVAEVREAIKAQAIEDDVIRRCAPVDQFNDAQPNDFFRLDPNYYYRPFLDSPRRCPIRGDDGENPRTNTETRPKLKKLLDEVYAAAGAPPAYYALLLADGDRLGTLVGELGPEKVSVALSAFGARVAQIVRQHDGVTVYAGGDDVLAMLPVHSALHCADQLAVAYKEKFRGELRRPATLSAAVVFTHIRAPLGGALDYTHQMLDGVAKDGNGRDSLVAAILKPGGPHAQWVSSWERRYSGERTARAVVQLDLLKAALTNECAGPGFSASLLHHIRDVLEILAGLRRWAPGKTGELPDATDLPAFIRAELVDSWAHRLRDNEPTPGDLKALTDLVSDLLARSRGSRLETPPCPQDKAGAPAEPESPGTAEGPPQVDIRHVGIDALLVAQFLAGGGKEDEHA